MSSALLTLPDTNPAHFLRIAGQGSSVSTHADLWRWLQGDVQQWLDHEVMLIGWGDFRSGELQYDIVSSLPGMRSHHWTAASISPLLSYLRDCWAAAQQAPCQFDISGSATLLRDGSGREPVQSLATMRSAVVHGLREAGGGERIFAALGARGPRTGGAGAVLKLLLPFIDTALRRMPPAPQRQAHCRGPLPARQVASLAALSEREHEIMTWVAMGKTNPEIGCILSISEFTVKNHMKSIFSKLDVTNRAQAVAKLTRVGAYA